MVGAGPPGGLAAFSGHFCTSQVHNRPENGRVVVEDLGLAGPAAPVEIRELASAEEARALGVLTVAAYTGLAGLVPGAPYLDELADVERRAAEAVVLVAVEGDGRLAGGVTYVPGPGPYAEFDDPAGAGLRMLAVAAGHRGRGTGTLLVRACIDRARAEGRRRLWLHTTADLATAHRIYARLGFRRAPDHDRPLPEIRLLAYVLDLDPPSRAAGS